MTPKERLLKLEEYYKASRWAFKIGNGEQMLNYQYVDKVRKINELNQTLRKLENELN